MFESKGKKLNPVQQDAMLKVCNEIMDDMDNVMGEGLEAKKGGMKKVSVVADSEEGLEEGLEKAEEVVEGEEEMVAESEDDEEIDFSGLSENQIDELLQKLMAAKEQKKVKSPV